MKVVLLASGILALTALVIVAPIASGREHRQANLTQTTCDNDGHCTTLKAPAARPQPRQARLSKQAGKDHAHAAAIDANGNTSGLIVSSRTGARARVGAAYAARFQAYV